MGMVYNSSVVRDGLVFHYDMENSKKSWKGAPTTNLFVSPANLSSGSWTRNQTGYNTNSGKAYINSVAAGNYFLQDQPLTSGVTYTCSIEAKAAEARWIQITPSTGFPIADYANISLDDGTIAGSTGGQSKANAVELGNGWWRVSYTETANVTGNGRMAFSIVDENTGRLSSPSATLSNQDGLYIRATQMEAKSFATPYVNGTRSNTEGLIDLTGNNTITLQSLVEYSSDGTFSFDGTNFNSYASFGSQGINSKSYSVECWFNADTVNRTQGVLGDAQYNWWRFNVSAGNKVDVFHKESDALGGSGVVGTTTIQAGVWYQAVMVFDMAVGMSLYVNGQLDNSNTDTQPFYPAVTTRGPQFIGHYRGGAPTSANVFDGKISIIRIYKNKVLTADEVLQNFEATRGRYGV